MVVGRSDPDTDHWIPSLSLSHSAIAVGLREQERKRGGEAELDDESLGLAAVRALSSAANSASA
jgi:hypothetical protein